MVKTQDKYMVDIIFLTEEKPHYGVYESIKIARIPLEKIVKTDKVISIVEDILEKMRMIGAFGAFSIKPDFIDKQALTNYLINNTNAVEVLTNELDEEPEQIKEMLTGHRDLVMYPTIDVEMVNSKVSLELSVVS